MLAKCFKVFIRLCVWLAILLVCLLCLYVSLGRLLSPLLPDYRDDIEQLLSREMQQQITLGYIRAEWHGLTPTIKASDVSIGLGKRRLKAEQLMFRPNIWQSLLHLQFRVELVGIKGLSLSLEQNEQGDWSLSGLRESNEGDSADESTDVQLLVPQVQRVETLSLLNAKVTVHPWQAEPFSFERVDITVRNGLLSQEVQARIQLPDQKELELSVQSRGQLTELSTLNAELYLKAPHSDWATWLATFVPDSINRLSFAGQLWLDIDQGRLKQGVIAIAEAQIQAQYQEQPSIVILGPTTGFFQASAGKKDLWFEQLPLRFGLKAEQLNWPVHFTQLEQEEGKVGVIELRMPQLQLQPVMQQLDAHLEHALTREILKTLSFQGGFENLYVRWQPDAEFKQRLQFDTNLANVEYSPWQSVPGASGISGRIRGDLAQGELQLNSQGFMLNLYDFFSEPWHYESAAATLTWEFDKKGFWLKSPYLQVKGDEGDIAGDFAIRLLNADEGAENYMDLRVGMREGDASYTRRYLPRVLEENQPELFNWLVQAVQKGTVKEGYFQYQGSLSSSTPSEATSISLYFDVEDAALEYQPHWPVLKDGVAQVFVHDWGVQVELDKGSILQTALNNALAEVKYAEGNEVTRLLVQSELASNATDGLYILQNTPLSKEVTALAAWQGTGQIPAQLKLNIPFANGLEPHVQLDMQLEQVDVNMQDLDIHLQGVTGALSFDSVQGLSSKQLDGRFLNQPFVASVAGNGVQEGLETVVRAEGSMAAEVLQNWLAPDVYWPWSGTLEYQLRVLLDGDDSQLVVETDLTGVELALPVPFGKQKESAVATRWHMTLSGPERHYWLDYGKQLSLFLAKRDAQQFRGELVLGGERAQLPTQHGIFVRGALDELPVNQWLELAKHYTHAEGVATKHANSLQAAQLQIKRITELPLHVYDATVGYQAQADSRWSASLKSPQLSGSIEDGQPNEPMHVSIDYLHVPSFPEKKASELQSAKLQMRPKNIPHVQVHIQQLFQNEKLLGGGEFVLAPVATGLEVRDIAAQVLGLNVTGTLKWEDSSSSFAGELSGENIGDTLSEWGYADTMSSETYRSDINVSWPGAPTDFALEQLSGDLYLSFRKGQLYLSDTGSKALRVFGLLNFDTIGRRLRLDFSDLYSRGLSYDTFKGRVSIAQGVYKTIDAITLNGVSSELTLEGQVDLPTSQVDAEVQVIMPITNNLPLAAVLAGAPAIGGALFIMDRLVGDRLDKVAAVKYRITGDWQDPTMTLEDKL